MTSIYSKKVGIVGKVLLFDTGGYNIKTAMMELMKFDCGGSVSHSNCFLMKLKSDHYLISWTL